MRMEGGVQDTLTDVIVGEDPPPPPLLEPPPPQPAATVMIPVANNREANSHPIRKELLSRPFTGICAAFQWDCQQAYNDWTEFLLNLRHI